MAGPRGVGCGQCFRRRCDSGLRDNCGTHGLSAKSRALPFALSRPDPGYRAPAIGNLLGGLGALRSAKSTALVAALSLVAWGFEAGMYYALMFSFPFAPSFWQRPWAPRRQILARWCHPRRVHWHVRPAAFVRPNRNVRYRSFSRNKLYSARSRGADRSRHLLGLVLLWREGLSLRRDKRRGSAGEGQGASRGEDRVLVRRSPS